jgi:putative Mg2+ transporter-C (MgtC) family protein
VGLAAGIGFIEGVVIVLILLVLTLKVLGKLDTVVRKSGKEIDLYIEFVDNKALLNFCDKIKTDGHHITKMQIGKWDGENDYPNALFSIRTKDRDHASKLAVELRRLKYVKVVEEL